MTEVQLAQPGTTLFHLAAKCFGDATQWSRLAQVNNIQDPFLSEAVVLVIPTNRSAQG